MPGPAAPCLQTSSPSFIWEHICGGVNIDLGKNNIYSSPGKQGLFFFFFAVFLLFSPLFPQAALSAPLAAPAARSLRSRSRFLGPEQNPPRLPAPTKPKRFARERIKQRAQAVPSAEVSPSLRQPEPLRSRALNPATLRLFSPLGGRCILTSKTPRNVHFSQPPSKLSCRDLGEKGRALPPPHRAASPALLPPTKEPRSDPARARLFVFYSPPNKS